MFGKNSYKHFIFIFVLFLVHCAKPTTVSSLMEESKKNSSKEADESSCLRVFSQSGFCLFWYWELKPTSNSLGSFIFKTYRINSFDQTPIQEDLQYSPEVILWMPSMGHGSTPTTVERLDTGTYRVNEVFFTMPGEWDIEIKVKKESEVLDEAKISLVF